MKKVTEKQINEYCDWVLKTLESKLNNACHEMIENICEDPTKTKIDPTQIDDVIEQFTQVMYQSIESAKSHVFDKNTESKQNEFAHESEEGRKTAFAKIICGIYQKKLEIDDLECDLGRFLGFIDKNNSEQQESAEWY